MLAMQRHELRMAKGDCKFANEYRHSVFMYGDYHMLKSNKSIRRLPWQVGSISLPPPSISLEVPAIGVRPDNVILRLMQKECTFVDLRRAQWSTTSDHKCEAFRQLHKTLLNDRPYMFSAAALFLGYHGLFRSYEDATDAVTTSSTLQLTIYAFLTGVGGCLASGASINTCAKNFPSHRGTATGVAVMALGLGAFVYSAASKLFLSGDPGSLLNLLAISTAVVMLTGCVYVHVQDPKHSKVIPYTPLDRPSRLSFEAGDVSSQSLESSDIRDDLFQPQQHDTVHPDHVGSALMKPDFAILILICGLLSGCGLMYINNVGHCVEALVHAQINEDHSLVNKLQSTHVAIISLSSAFARVIAGTSSDILKSRFGIPRNAVLIAANVLALVAQCSGYLANDPNWLILVSTLVGLAYGSLFGCCPSILSEYFGMTCVVNLPLLSATNEEQRVFSELGMAHNGSRPIWSTLQSGVW